MIGEMRRTMNTLTFFNNQQYDPINIQDFCIVEVYKNSITKDNILGYYIQPLKDITNPIETIENRVRRSVATDLTELVILPGREINQLSHKIVYAVFYDSNAEKPIYPLLPEEIELGKPAQQLDIYETIELNNEGTPTDCTIKLIISTLAKDIEFFINGRKYLIYASELPPAPEKVLIINKYGVTYNSIPVDKFEFMQPPQLQHGHNIIKVDRATVSDIEITYLRKY